MIQMQFQTKSIIKKIGVFVFMFYCVFTTMIFAYMLFDDYSNLNSGESIFSISLILFNVLGFFIGGGYLKTIKEVGMDAKTI